MSEPFIAEIKIFAGNFAPRGYAFCKGDLLPIAQNTALFSLIGTIYGGDGRTTLGLPDLQGRAPIARGNGPGLSSRRMGEKTGTATVTVNENQLPSHSHTAKGSENPAVDNNPTNNYVARGGGRGTNVYTNAADSPGASKALAPAGGGQPHNNMQPYLVMSFIIALVGLYPSRS